MPHLSNISVLSLADQINSCESVHTLTTKLKCTLANTILVAAGRHV